MLDLKDLHWVAGLLEGEGSFLVHRSNTHDRRYLRIHCNMTDHDVIERLHALVGGTINGPYVERDRVKTRWNWYLQRTGQTLSWMYMLYPLMGQRRQTQIRSAIIEILGREDWAMAA